MTDRSGTRFLAGICVVSLAGLLFSGFSARGNAARGLELQRQMRAKSDSLVVLSAGLRGTTEVLARHVTLPRSFAAQGGILLYGVRVDCAACGRNAGTLNRLAARFPGRVIGVSEDDSAAVAAFSRRHGLAIPVRALARSDVRALFPEKIAPVAILFQDNKVIEIAFGSLDERFQSRITAILLGSGDR